MPGSPSKTVQSVDRALALLRTIAESETAPSLAELALGCNLERPTAWRLLWTLEQNGLVEKVEPSRYRLSLGWLGFSHRHALDSLVRLARPVLEDLAARCEVTASLVYVHRFGLEYIDHVDGPVFTTPKWEGPASWHGSSPGKAVLAALPDAEWRALVGPELAKLTDTTITDVEGLADELATVRRRGYAVCHGEDVTYSNGASAVIRSAGRPVAAFSLWGADRRVGAAYLKALGEAAVDGAARVEAALS